MSGRHMAIESHRVAIRTKYLGPTNTQGSRIRVWRADSTYADDPNRLTVEWEYAFDIGENHAEAIRQYIDRAGWVWPNGAWVVGGGMSGSFAVWAPGYSPEEGS